MIVMGGNNVKMTAAGWEKTTPGDPQGRLGNEQGGVGERGKNEGAMLTNNRVGTRN